MPSLELKTNVPLSDPKPFLLEFSSVRLFHKASGMTRFHSPFVYPLVRSEDAQEAGAIRLRELPLQREPYLQRLV